MSNVLNMDSIVCGLMRIWSLLLTSIKYNLIWLYLKLSKCHYHVCYWKASIKANPSNQYMKWQLINLFEQISAIASTWNLSQKFWMWWNLKSFNLLTNLSFFHHVDVLQTVIFHVIAQNTMFCSKFLRDASKS